MTPEKSSLYCLLFFSIFFYNSFSQSQPPLLSEDPRLQQQWVDSIYDAMTLEEKIGQLFMVGLPSNAPTATIEDTRNLIREEHIGGVLFLKGGPHQQAELTNEFQEISEVPLLVGMDAEWGLAMRLDSTFAFPWNMTLGAIQDNDLIKQVGRRIGGHARRLGVNINFAPVVDINTNPDNPIIGNRSFGEDRVAVAEKAAAFIQGMGQAHVLNTAKHFPGHGDTQKDSHKTLPTVDFSKVRLYREELYPYVALIDQGLDGVMVGHLNVPSLEKRSNIPASLSHDIVTGILKEEFGFKGLVITDALNMKGVSSFSSSGEVDLAAFLAGNDVLLMSEDVPVAVEKLKHAYQEGLITEERLGHSVRKILGAKYKAGLHKIETVDQDYLYEDLNSVRDELLTHKLFAHAMTVVKNDKRTVPIRGLEKTKIAYVSLGSAEGDSFLDQLKQYSAVDAVSAKSLDTLLEKLQKYNLVIIGFHKSNASPWSDYRMDQQDQAWLYEIARQNRVILNVFTSPYALLDLRTTGNIEAIQVAYQNHPVAQEKAAQVLFGGIQAKGKLPVSAGEEFPVGTGYNTEDLQRLSYGIPESVGMNSYTLRRIDSIIQRVIDKKMAPGVQVLVARHGKVIYQNYSGYHTYKKKNPVKGTDVYDLASLTKILATLPLVMELVEKDELDLSTTLKEMLPEFEGTDKADITLLEMLSHYARLKPWIPFHMMTMDSGKPDKNYLRNREMPGFNTKIAEGMFVRNDIRDSIVKVIRESELNRVKEYQYSDLPYYLLKAYLENIYGTSLDYLTQDHFYQSIGANNTGYLPLNRFDPDRIIPTENDHVWRNQLLKGYVHDQGAALLGGIGGQAGLFSNANDVAKIMQMYLNGGYYGGKQYFRQQTINKFNTCYYCEDQVRRGVGFDKPQLQEIGPTCGCVSMTSFGHSGFTGTLTWADPHEGIVYVFLSNRVHPSARSNHLVEEGIRTEIQKIIYEAIVR